MIHVSNVLLPWSHVCLRFEGLSLRWNQTGKRVTGDGSRGLSASQFREPTLLYIDANGAANGVTVIDTTVDGDHPEAFTFDKNGYIYLSSHNNNRVILYPPEFSNGTTVAGKNGVSSSALDRPNNPLGVDIDDDLNLYIIDGNNKRVMKWVPNATNGTIVIGSASTPSFYGSLLSLYSSNEAYVSSEDTIPVYLWTFGASSHRVTLTHVNVTPSLLKAPKCMRHDSYGNLYVADSDNSRVVMYCANSTVGTVVVSGADSTPTLGQPDDVTLDSNLNIYAVDENNQVVIKYEKL
ncbi:unnamed protein product [Rotaria sp. Silwood1]|nr:unnamed protein product [Rotaria sp. Silwood1]